MKDFVNKINRDKKISQSELLTILQDFQNQFGYIDLNFIEDLSKIIKIPAGKIYGIATFYNQFRFRPHGKYHIGFCSGATCHINGANNLKNELQNYIRLNNETNISGDKFSIEYIPCMGACAQGPVIKINDKYITKMTLSKLKKILQELE